MWTRIHKETFLEVINGDEVAEVDLTKDVLIQRYKFAKEVERTPSGYEFKYLTLDKKKEITMELIHAPKYKKRTVKSRHNEGFETWVTRIYAN